MDDKLNRKNGIHTFTKTQYSLEYLKFINLNNIRVERQSENAHCLLLILWVLPKFKIYCSECLGSLEGWEAGIVLGIELLELGKFLCADLGNVEIVSIKPLGDVVLSDALAPGDVCLLKSCLLLVSEVLRGV
jgi:hypothetical protein